MTDRVRGQSGPVRSLCQKIGGKHARQARSPRSQRDDCLVPLCRACSLQTLCCCADATQSHASRFCPLRSRTDNLQPAVRELKSLNCCNASTNSMHGEDQRHLTLKGGSRRPKALRDQSRLSFLQGPCICTQQQLEGLLLLTTFNWQWVHTIDTRLTITLHNMYTYQIHQVPLSSWIEQFQLTVNTFDLPQWGSDMQKQNWPKQ